MKEFFKMLLAVICGLLLMGILSIFLLSGLVASLSLSGGSQPPIAKEGVLGIDMSRIVITEQNNPQDPFASMQGQGVKPVGLIPAIEAIRMAANDPGIKYIFIRPDGSGSSLAATEELRKALALFRSSGKAVIAYT